ncbi:hypothetical protein HGRIS_001139 [Hohenbuehelia grisea]|uniref:Uncharacterized protein n=1 Tax=Hohenbuehelia grisea TaxID=104357 RepID=A0ABR3JNL4_9AGAR
MRHAKELARSMKFNRRNIESRWYSIFNHALMRLVEFDIFDDCMGREHALSIHPHCDVSVARDIWRQHYLAKLAMSSFFDAVDNDQSVKPKEDDDDPSSDYEPSMDVDPEEINLLPSGNWTLRPLAAPEPPIEDNAELEDTSWAAFVAQCERVQRNEQEAANMDHDRSFESQSSGKTESDKDGVHTIPDFFAAHTVSKGLRRNGDPLVFHECIALILECKAAPSRSKANGPGYEHELRLHLEDAHEQLILYLAVHFTKEPAAKSVIAMASSGPYWHWMKVERGEVPSLQFVRKYQDLHRPDLLHVPAEERNDCGLSLALMERWDNVGKAYNMGKPQSDEALMRMREDLISVVQECRCQVPASRKA